MIWYLSVTEIIVLSIPLIQIDIENDVRSGDVVYQLLKPINYLWLKIAESVGAFLFRFGILILIAIPFCAYLSGVIPPLSVLCSAYVMAALAGIVFILFQTTIGLLAFKLQDTTPIFWLWQRSSFLLGGLVIPLDFYPSILKVFAYLTPFASLLFAPARLVLEFSVENLLIAFAGLLFWAIVAILLAERLYVRMLKALKVNGG